MVSSEGLTISKSPTDEIKVFEINVSVTPFLHSVLHGVLRMVAERMLTRTVYGEV